MRAYSGGKAVTRVRDIPEGCVPAEADRMLERADAQSSPMAVSTWEGSLCPVLQGGDGPALRVTGPPSQVSRVLSIALRATDLRSALDA